MGAHMAMDAASTSRRLWQVPTFLLGIGALVAVGYDLPGMKITPEQRFQKDFDALRQAIDRNPVDAAQVQSLLHKVHGMEAPANLAKQAPFVIGSALVIFAESTAAPEEAAEQWKTARKLLENAAEIGVPDRGQAPLPIPAGQDLGENGRAAAENHRRAECLHQVRRRSR